MISYDMIKYDETTIYRFKRYRISQLNNFKLLTVKKTLPLQYILHASKMSYKCFINRFVSFNYTKHKMVDIKTLKMHR